ncbi:hypothetical protein, partial [Moraxella lacunata]|uniref:hypothetical protein n=1 Tax=Moraxella lacunata TaxID=477 RepID=UPI0024ADA834
MKHEKALMSFWNKWYYKMKGWACYFPIWHKYSIFGNMAIGVCTFIRIRHVQLTKLNFTTETVRPCINPTPNLDYL